MNALEATIISLPRGGRRRLDYTETINSSGLKLTGKMTRQLLNVGDEGLCGAAGSRGQSWGWGEGVEGVRDGRGKGTPEVHPHN